MLSFKRLTAVLTVGILSICSSSNYVRFAPAETFAAYDDCNDDWLHAEGSRLYDKNGNEVWLTGVNWFGFSGVENCGHGLWTKDIDDLLEEISDRGFNVVHIPVSTELLLSWMNNKPLDVSSVNVWSNTNSDFLSDDNYIKNSMEIFDIIIKKMKNYGLKVIIGIGSPAACNNGSYYNLWYYKEGVSNAGNAAIGAFSEEPITWDDWINSLTWLADKYCNDDTIIGYDLKELPHGGKEDSDTDSSDGYAKWDNSADLNNWSYSATRCADSILNVNPNALIFIEGISEYQDPITLKNYYSFFGANLRGVKSYPIKIGHDSSQIIYASNDFANLSSVSEYTQETILNEYWYDTWAYINETEIAPIYMAKWGSDIGELKSSRNWLEALRDYMVKHHISHSYWQLNPNTCAAGLYESNWTEWDEEVYEFVKPTLWQTQGANESSNTKFISLDHQTSLGQNGISLSEYYNTYAFTEGSNIDGGTIVIPDGITCIYPSDLEVNKYASSIIIPSSVFEIPSGTFSAISDINIKDVFYKGSKEQWDSIVINSDNDALSNANIHFMDSSVSKPPLSIEEDEITLSNGQQYKIVPNQTDLVYKSNNVDIAVVSQEGIVTAVGIGSAIISVINTDGEVVQLKVNVTKAMVQGDCNSDGIFSIADVVTLQKWIINDGTELSDWKAADLCEDGIINVFDLVMMKRKLLR